MRCGFEHVNPSTTSWPGRAARSTASNARCFLQDHPNLGCSWYGMERSDALTRRLELTRFRGQVNETGS